MVSLIRSFVLLLVSFFPIKLVRMIKLNGFLSENRSKIGTESEYEYWKAFKLSQAYPHLEDITTLMVKEKTMRSGRLVPVLG